MATDDKVSVLVERQFPDFVRDEGPNLVAFIKAYYEWAEQANGFIEVTKNLENYQDVDDSIEKYVDYIEREIIPNLPKEALVNRRLFAKHAKDLYRARGSEESYRLLFRILFDEEPTYYYPGEDILRVSDGRWVVDTSIRVGEPQLGTTADLEGSRITGINSGASAIVEKILSTIEAGRVVNEMFLSEVSGTFQDGERVRNSSNTINTTILSQIGPVQSVSIIDGGALHQVGDSVSITYSGVTTPAAGVVTSLNTTSAFKLNITDGGSGYRVGDAVITHSGGSGVGGSFSVATVANTELLNLNTDQISDVKNVTLDTSPNFTSLGTNSASLSSNLASSNVNSPLNSALEFSNLTVGTINSISISDYGYDYSVLPTNVIAEDSGVSALREADGSGGFKGLNAVLTPVHEPTAISSVLISSFGSGFNRYETVTIQNTSRSGTDSATAIPSVSGIITYDGKYTDTKGFISWNNRLQDNYYYQEFSYEIGSNQFMKSYQRLVERLLHPAGTKMFGRVKKDLIANAQIITISTNTQTMSTGTGTITGNGSMTVSGSGTRFLAELSNNSIIYVVETGNFYFISEVVSHTELMTTTNTEIFSGTIFYYDSTGFPDYADLGDFVPAQVDPQVTYLGTYQTSTSLTDGNVTFSSVNIGSAATNRMVIVAPGFTKTSIIGGNDIHRVWVNDILASRLVHNPDGSTDVHQDMYGAWVPTGTSASVVIEHEGDGTANRRAMSVYRAIDPYVLDGAFFTYNYANNIGVDLATNGTAIFASTFRTANVSTLTGTTVTDDSRSANTVHYFVSGRRVATVAESNTAFGRSFHDARSVVSSLSAPASGWSIPPVGLVVWLDANQGAYTDVAGTTLAANGEFIYSWKNKAPMRTTDRLVTAANTALRPMFNTNKQNSLPGIVFSGAQELSFDRDPDTNWAQGIYIFAVAKRTRTVAGSQMPIFNHHTGNATNTNGVYSLGWETDFRMKARVFTDATSGSNLEAASNVAANTAGMFEISWSKQDSGTLRLIENEIELASGSTGGGLALWGQGPPVYAKVGASNNGVNYLEGEVYEIIVYNRYLTPTEIGNIRAYLALKWGL